MGDTAARLAMLARRNEVFRFTIAVAGIDMTGVALNMQVRLARGTPGAPLIQLVTVNTSAAEGLKFDSVSVTNGVATSIIKGRINQSTMSDAAKVPYAGEQGADTILAYAMQWILNGDANTRLEGDFIVRDTAYGSDSAPASRPASYGTPPTGAGSASGTLTFGDQVIAVSISDADILGGMVVASAASQLASATSATTAAAAAHDAQLAQTGSAALGAGFADRLKGYSSSASRHAVLGAVTSYGRLFLGWSKLSGAQIAGGYSKARHGHAVHDAYGRPLASMSKTGLPTYPGWIGQGALLNRDAIRFWRSKAQGARFRGERAAVAIIADSQYDYSAGRAALPLAERLQAAFGDGGPGWLSPDSVTMPARASTAMPGTGWERSLNPASPNQIAYTSSTLGDRAYAIWNGPGTITVAELHHCGGGGTINYSYGGASKEIILPADPGKVVLDAPPAGAFGLTVTLVSGTFSFAGFAMLKAAGAVVHNISVGGTTAMGWATADQAVWRAALARLGADAVLFHLGGNDEAASRTVDQYRSDMATLIDSVRTVFGPSADIIVAVRAQTKRNGILWRMGTYAEAMKALARPSRFAMFDAAKRFGNHPSEYGYTGSIMQTLQSDDLHYNQLGRDIAASGPAELLGA